MKIAAFYENIADGVRAAGVSMEETLASLREEGMERLYISVESWKRDGHALQGILRRQHIALEGMHGFCDFPGDPGTGAYRDMIDIAADSGAEHLLFVPGMLSTGNTLRDLESITEGMRRAVAYGQAKKLPILMEDFDGLLSPYNCIAGLDYFMRQIDGLECAFDTGNFVIFHEDELVAFDLFAPRIRTLHLKDRCTAPRHEGDIPLRCADGRPVYCCTVGSGDIRMAQILERLKQMRYPGNVIAELYCVDHREVLEDLRQSVRWLREQGIGDTDGVR
ncbi:MAG: sugar phosphate isomerase/epimerase [Clostridia bacterium]|nr:sugar phosphate isomerase/epimerase [Clostridia bacterium]